MKVNGQWRIVDPPQRRLLSKSAFLRVYQPRNLYFFGAGGVLVPDPVFVPLQATTTGLATDLVKALRQRPLSYLSGVTKTDLPRRTTLVGQVKIEGPGAIVNLAGPVSQAGPAEIAGIAAQLVWTLTSSSYGSQTIKWVKLEVNGRLPGCTGRGRRNRVAGQVFRPGPQAIGPRRAVLHRHGRSGPGAAAVGRRTSGPRSWAGGHRAGPDDIDCRLPGQPAVYRRHRRRWPGGRFRPAGQGRGTPVLAAGRQDHLAELGRPR